MEREVITRIKLSASEGMKLTNGKDIVDDTFLAVGDPEDNWHEITEAEAQEIMDVEAEETI